MCRDAQRLVAVLALWAAPAVAALARGTFKLWRQERERAASGSMEVAAGGG